MHSVCTVFKMRKLRQSRSIGSPILSYHKYNNSCDGTFLFQHQRLIGSMLLRFQFV